MNGLGDNRNGALCPVVAIMSHKADLRFAPRYNKLATAGRREIDGFTGRERNGNPLRLFYEPGHFYRCAFLGMRTSRDIDRTDYRFHLHCHWIQLALTTRFPYFTLGEMRSWIHAIFKQPGFRIKLYVFEFSHVSQ